MSFFSRIFGGGNKNEPAPTPARGGTPPPRGGGGGGQKNNMEALNDHVDIIEKRQEVLEMKISKELEKAKQHLASKNKNAASQCLQRKKIYENQLSKLQAQHMNVERLKLALEETTMNAEVIKAQRLAAQDLARLQKGMAPEAVDRDMENMRDLMEKTNEVSEALAQNLGGDALDEGDLDDELAALEQDMLDAKIAQVAPAQKGPGIALPAVPNGKITAPKQSEAVAPVKQSVAPVKQSVAQADEDDLEALERELNS